MKKLMALLGVLTTTSTVFAGGISSTCTEIDHETQVIGEKMVITRTYAKAQCSLKDIESLVQRFAIATPDPDLKLALPSNISIKFSPIAAIITVTFDNNKPQW